MTNIRELIADGVRYQRSGSLEKALKNYSAALAEAVTPAEKAEALRHQADVYRTQCEWDHGLSAARRSAAIAREADLPVLLAEAINSEAAIHLLRGDHVEASALYEQMLVDAPDDRIRGIALQNLGSIAARSGDLEKAEDRFRLSSENFRRAGYARGEAIALNNYTAVALDRGNYETARTIGEDAIAAAQKLDDLELVGIANLNYAEALVHLGEYDRAEELASAALGYFDVTPNRWRQVRCLLLLGKMSTHRGDPETARRVYERGLRLASEIDAPAEIAELSARLERLPQP